MIIWTLTKYIGYFGFFIFGIITIAVGFVPCMLLFFFAAIVQECEEQQLLIRTGRNKKLHRGTSNEHVN